jgi:hypothetical protein
MDELKHDIRETITSTEVSELTLISHNILKRFTEVLIAERRHFDDLL